MRYNQITDKGAELIGVELGTPQQANLKLLSLNLNGNSITDVGVAHLAKVNIYLLSKNFFNVKVKCLKGWVGKKTFDFFCCFCEVMIH